MSEEFTNSAPRERHRAVRLIAYVLMLAATLGLLELGARLVYYIHDNQIIWLGLSEEALMATLDDYEMVDPNNRGHWILRADEYSSKRLLQGKRDRGAVLGETRIQTLTERHEILPDTVVMKINSAGFKGPELRTERSGVRILALGDSCTFGTWADEFSYPRAMQRAFGEVGVDAEVINGGVEGYGPRNLKLRLKEYIALEPDVVTIYIGWNALYSRKVANQHPLRTIRLLRTAWGILNTPEDRTLTHAAVPDRDDPLIDTLSDANFWFLDDVKEIVRAFQASGSEVVLISLPGLFQTDETPSEKALKMGHLPSYTTNPYAFAAVTDAYNHALQKLAKDSGAHFVDLAAWGRGKFKPRDAYFFDSVHLEEFAQSLIGEYLATELLPTVVGLSGQSTEQDRRPESR